MNPQYPDYSIQMTACFKDSDLEREWTARANSNNNVIYRTIASLDFAAHEPNDYRDENPNDYIASIYNSI